MIHLVNWKAIALVLTAITIVLAVLVVQPLFISSSISEKVANNTIDYINSYLLPDGGKAKLDKAEDETMIIQKIVVNVSGQQFNSYVSLDGKYLFAQDPINITTPSSSGYNLKKTIKPSMEVGGFTEIKDGDVCRENGKLIVYFFGSSTDPHSKWEEPILLSVVTNKWLLVPVSYHENIDSMIDRDVFEKYSSGTVPLIVVGCKYYRVGSGEPFGEIAEREVLEQVIWRASGGA